MSKKSYLNILLVVILIKLLEAKVFQPEQSNQNNTNQNFNNTFLENNNLTTTLIASINIKENGEQNSNPILKDGPIVSPTKSEGANDGDKEVVITNKNLHETKSIRGEIQHAVQGNTYVVQSTLDENKTSSVNENESEVSDGPIVSPTKSEGANDGDKEVVITNINLHETESIRGEIQHAVQGNTYVVQSTLDENKTSSVTGNESGVSQVSDVPIVSPTKSEGANAGNKEVVITNKNLYETSIIRQEISKAVENDQYVVGVPTELVDAADHLLGLNYRMKNFYSNLIGSTDSNQINETVDFVGFDLDDSNHFELDSQQLNTSISSKEENSTSGVANVVESQFTNKENKFNFTNFLPKRNPNREVLTLISIEEDINFSFGYDIKEWRVLKMENNNFLVGVQDMSISIAVKDNFANATKINFSLPINYVETFVKWNSTSGKSEGIVIVAIENMLFWIEVKAFRIFWKINIGKNITSLRYYCDEDDDFLAILTNHTDLSTPAVQIYKFNLTTQEIWLKQNIPLTHACSEIVILHTGRDIVLALPQGNITKILSYNPDLQYQAHFQIIAEFPSEGVTAISGFQMGGYYYIAIGCNKSKILRYHRGNFIPQTILDENFGSVELFYPIPARTYRDDMILIVQHRIDFNSHSISVLEALIWDGESFESSPQIPCKIGNEIYNFGVSCMIDLRRPKGILGAAILDSGRNISIIVPREDAPSGIFQIHTKLSERNTEIEELEKVYEYLKIIANEQAEIIDEAENYLENSENNSMKLDLEYFSTSELYFDGEIDRIFLNENEWTENDTKIDLELLTNELEEIVKLLNFTELYDNLNISVSSHELSLSGKNKRQIVHNEMELDDVVIDNLMVEEINNIPFEDYVFIKDNQLTFNGSIVFENEIIVENELDSDIDETFEDITNDGIVESNALVIDGNLEFDSINGILWNDFLQSVVITNFPNQIDMLEIEGDVLINGGLEINTLNELKFPNDFLWSSGPEFSIITAEKHFMKKLTSSAIDTHGALINGVDPFDFINLSDDQYIPGHTVFKHLEVSERLQLNGSVSGHGLNKFLTNPNLLHTNLIHSECDFHKLIVDGPIKIAGNFNGVNLDTFLNDVVYKTEDLVIISSSKKFNNIEFTNDIEISSNSISEININDFLTTDTEQQLNITKFNGNIFINKLYLGGLVNSVNVTKLNENSLKINEDFQSDMELVFDEPNGIKIDNLIVDETLNNISISNFISVYDDFHLNETEFDSMEIINLITNCNITGSNILNGFNLNNLENHHIIFNTDNQKLTENIKIEEIYVENLTTELINGLKSEFILSYLQKIENINEMIKAGQLHVEEITINGDIYINNINNYNFDEIQSNVIWLNQPNIIVNHLKFFERIITEDLKIEDKLNHHNFKSILNDIIFKDDHIIISGYKKFSESIYVNGNSEIDIINSIPFSKIATKKSNIDFPGSLYIVGNLDVKHLVIENSINDMDIRDLHNNFYYNESLQSYVLGGEVYFKGFTKINNLQIDGSINDIKNVPKFFDNLVIKSQSTIITGKKIFKNLVYFSNGLYIKNFNSINLTEFFENIVYIHEHEEVIVNGPVIFNGSVEAGFIEIEDTLHTSNLQGCSLHEWQMNSIRTDLPYNFEVLHFGPGALDGNSLNVIQINDHHLSQLITLHTQQNFSEHMKIAELYLEDSMISQGSINGGVNLKEESENTLMNYGDQHIYAVTTMKSFKVLNNLITNSLVNGKNLSNCATLNENIEFYSPISFNNLTVQNLYCNDQISGINFEDWYHKSLWLNGKDNQIITGNWSVKNFTTENPIYGNGLINDFSLDEIKSQLNGPSSELTKTLQELNYDYHSKCQIIEELIEKSQNRIYFVRYFEENLKLIENNVINKIEFFKHTNGDMFMLTNVHCQSTIYQWDMNLFKFIKIKEFESGIVNQFIAVPKRDGNLKIVINSLNNSTHGCRLDGGNVWNFNLKYNLEHYGNLDHFGEFSMIHHVPETYEQFYGIDERNKLVIEIPVNRLNESKSWDLPADVHGSYRFLPNDADLGIALSDGKRILVVDPTSRRRFRYKRNVNTTKTLHLFSTPSKTDFEVEIFLRNNLKENFTLENIKTDIKPIINNIINKITEELKSLNKTNIGYSKICENCTDIKQAIQEIQKSNTTFSKYTTLISKNVENDTNLDEVTLIATKSIFILWHGLKDIEEVYNKSFSDKIQHKSTDKNLSIENVSDVLNLGIIEIGELGFNVSLKNDTKAKLLIKMLEKLNNNLKNITQTPASSVNVNNTFVDNFEIVNFKENLNLDSFKNDFKEIIGNLQMHMSNQVKNLNNTNKHILSNNNYNHMLEMKWILHEIQTQKILSSSINLSNYILSKNLTEPDPLIPISSQIVSFLWTGLKEVEEMFNYFENGKDIYQKAKVYYTNKLNKVESIKETAIFTSNTVQLLGNCIIDIANLNFQRTIDKNERINLLQEQFNIIDNQLTKILKIIDELTYPIINRSVTESDLSLLSSNLKENLTLFNFKEDLKEILESSLVHISDQLYTFNDTEEYYFYNDHDNHLIDIQGILSEIHSQKILPLGLDSIDLNKYHLNETINSNNVDRIIIIASRTIFFLWNSLKESEEILNYFDNGMEFYRKYIYNTINEYEKNKTFIEPTVLTSRVIRILSVGIIDLADLTFKMTMDTNQLKLLLEQRLKIIYNQLENNLKLLNAIPSCNFDDTIYNSAIISGKGELFNSSSSDTYADSKSEPFYVNLGSTLLESNGDFDIFDEPLIAEAIPERNLLTTDNSYFPSKNSGEILALKVGFKNNQRTLIAVSEPKDHFINGKHDSIRIYYDIMQGHLYQTIPTFKASHLTTLNIRDETLLAFVENNYFIKIYNYKGVEGFVKIAKFKIKHPVKLLTSISLPSYQQINDKFNNCPKNYFVAVMENYVQFYEAIMTGFCGIDSVVNCKNLS